MSPLSNPLLRGLLGRIFSISRRTWIFLSVTFLVLVALFIWAAISTAGWLFGMARDGVNAAPEAVRAATAQVEQVIPGRGCGEQDETVIAERGSEAADGLLDGRQALRAFDGDGDRNRGIVRRYRHPVPSSFRIASAASLPRALPARGLSPVNSLRSRCTAPEMPSLRISKPSALSFSPNFQVRWPGM